MSDALTFDDFEPSAWLRSAVRQRVQATALDPRIMQSVAYAIGDNRPATIVIGLNGPMPTPGSRGDRTCDRCDVFVPVADRIDFYAFQVTFAMPLGIDIAISIGLCRRCADREHIPEKVTR